MGDYNTLLFADLFPGIVKPPNDNLALGNSAQLLSFPLQILIKQLQTSSPLDM
jgi:hypothetical protein